MLEDRTARALANDPTEEVLTDNENVLVHLEFEHRIRYTFTAYRSSPDTVDLRATLKTGWRGPPHTASRQVTNREWEAFATGFRKTGVHRLKVEDSYSTEPTYFVIFFRDQGTCTYLQWIGPTFSGDEDVIYYLGNTNAGNLCTNLLSLLVKRDKARGEKIMSAQSPPVLAE